MREGDVITIEAGELVAGGAAIARLDGMPVFVSNVCPGDVARVRLSELKKGFAKAELVELLVPGNQRREAPCPVAGECGGCDWTALRLDHQLEAKRRILTESLRRIGRIDPGTLPPIHVHPSPLNYRIRSRFQRDGEVTGFYALRSNRVVPLPAECEVVGPRTARFVASSPAAAPADDEIWELDGRLLQGEQDVVIRVASWTWRLDTRAFFQVNRHLFGTMLRLVRSHASRVRHRQSAVDLFGGVGFFTLPIAGLFDSVTMVEGSPRSVHYARMNLPENVRVVHAPVERHVGRLEPADLVFLDPPRAGARPEVITAVGEKAKEMIAYLSCDPVTFSRDASRLIASGWRISTLDLLDLFPNTHHIETLCSFERAS